MRGGPQVRPSADAEATQSLWEEIDDKGDGIDWENISNQQQKSPRASKMAVNVSPGTHFFHSLSLAAVNLCGYYVGT
jgi:hypothetical protein